MKKLIELLDEPKIVGIVADPNQGKSNLIYAILRDLYMEKNPFGLYTFGLRMNITGAIQIHSVRELSAISNSLVVLDEFFSLLDLENRKEHRNIESILRTMYHSNNIIILCGLPDNFRKFIAAKLNMVIFKQCSIPDFVNGSRVKSICLEYRQPAHPAQGDPMTDPYILKMNINKALVWNSNPPLTPDGKTGEAWTTVTVPFIQNCDTKADLPPIFTLKGTSNAA